MSDHPFSLDSTRAAVHATLDEGLAAIPEGKRSAVLIDATTDHVQLLLAVKVGSAWTIAGGALYDGAHVTGRVAVMGSWA